MNNLDRKDFFFKFKRVVGGGILTDSKFTRFVPVVLYVFVLSLFLIANRNCSESTIRKIEKKQDELKELKSESIIYDVYLETMNLPSTMEKLVEEACLNLQLPQKPLEYIKVEDFDE